MEFYYTYKKHVKIGRNGTLNYGEAEPLESKTTGEELDNKVRHIPHSVTQPQTERCIKMCRIYTETEDICY